VSTSAMLVRDCVTQRISEDKIWSFKNVTLLVTESQDKKIQKISSFWNEMNRWNLASIPYLNNFSCWYVTCDCSNKGPCTLRNYVHGVECYLKTVITGPIGIGACHNMQNPRPIASGRLHGPVSTGTPAVITSSLRVTKRCNVLLL
jgi:hypothetical protein